MSGRRGDPLWAGCTSLRRESLFMARARVYRKSRRQGNENFVNSGRLARAESRDLEFLCTDPERPRAFSMRQSHTPLTIE